MIRLGFNRKCGLRIPSRTGKAVAIKLAARGEGHVVQRQIPRCHLRIACGDRNRTVRRIAAGPGRYSQALQIAPVKDTRESGVWIRVERAARATPNIGQAIHRRVIAQGRTHIAIDTALPERIARAAAARQAQRTKVTIPDIMTGNSWLRRSAGARNLPGLQGDKCVARVAAEYRYAWIRRPARRRTAREVLPDTEIKRMRLDGSKNGVFGTRFWTISAGLTCAS